MRTPFEKKQFKYKSFHRMLKQNFCKGCDAGNKWGCPFKNGQHVKFMNLDEYYGKIEFDNLMKDTIPANENLFCVYHIDAACEISHVQMKKLNKLCDTYLESMESLMPGSIDLDDIQV